MRVLVVDDNRSSADLIAKALRKRGDDAVACYDGATAIDHLQHHPVDLVLTDWAMSPVGGIDVLNAARAQRPPIEVIIFTGYGAIDTAVDAIKLGARDFLTKPITFTQLTSRMEALELERQGPQPSSAAPSEFLAVAPATRELLNQMQRIALAPSHVWIHGEVGSGRQFVAHTIHTMSDSKIPLTVIDPFRVTEHTATPEAGCLIIPNLDDLPEDMHHEFLLFLRKIPPEVRVFVTASDQPHESTSRTWQEIYYALAVLPLRVPPLRERPEDILPLYQRKLEHAAQRFQLDLPRMPNAIEQQALLQYAWPGNLRELFNLVERVLILGADTLLESFGQAPARRTPPSATPILGPGFDLVTHLESIERALIVEALRQAGGDRRVAGSLLNVERNTLRYKLRKYELLDD